MVVALIFRPQGLFGRRRRNAKPVSRTAPPPTLAGSTPARCAAPRAGSRPSSSSGCCRSIGWFAFPENLPLLSQIAITALFALSLDLILGYAGILSLGHAAFFGIGAYTAGFLAKYGWGDPLLGLAAALAVAALAGFVTSFLVLRGADLTRLMVTLGVVADALRGREQADAASPAASTACRASR